MKIGILWWTSGFIFLEKAAQDEAVRQGSHKTIIFGAIGLSNSRYISIIESKHP
jgi:hypothetical protein